MALSGIDEASGAGLIPAVAETDGGGVDQHSWLGQYYAGGQVFVQVCLLITQKLKLRDAKNLSSSGMMSAK